MFIIYNKLVLSCYFQGNIDIHLDLDEEHNKVALKTGSYSYSISPLYATSSLIPTRLRKKHHSYISHT